MMKNNPWNSCGEAFSVMFSDEAEFITSKGERGSLYCCLFPKEDVDPFVESDADSIIKSVSVLVKKCDWHFRTKPAIGDQVKICNDGKYKVMDVEDEQNWYRLTARSTGGSK